MTSRPCPICKTAAAPRPQNPAAPFCSERCKLVDLGRWLDESYRVPVRPEPDAEATIDDEAGGPH
jgi:endogenous inhibitor of DNA gyrase (YacG/DUF329 family)